MNIPLGMTIEAVLLSALVFFVIGVVTGFHVGKKSTNES